MPPKKAGKAKGDDGAKKPAKAARGRPKKKPVEEEEEEEEEDEEDEEEEEMMLAKAKAASKKKRTPKKAAAKEEDDDGEEEEEGEEGEGDGELDDEELDDELGLDDEDDELEDEDEDDEFEDEEDDEEGRPRNTLFLKNLPPNTSEEEIRALSSDIQTVRIEELRKGVIRPIFAVIDFADEETMTRHMESLKGKTIGGNEIIVDTVGTHSIVTFVTPALTPSSDPLKLYCTGFGRDITVEQLKAMFPSSIDISLPLNPKDNNRPIGYAFIHYDDEDICRKAHDASQDLIFQNRTLVVMYGKKTPPEGSVTNPPAETKRKSGAQKGPKSKKAKKQEEEEEEEDEEVGVE